MKLYVESATSVALQSAIKSNAHAIILTGDEGVGLSTIAADSVASSGAYIHTVLPEKDEKIDIEKGTITIQSIRRLYDMTKTKEPNGRVIIIDYAERMAPAAQNAFLKLLEEPTDGTRFILLTHQLELLLPTILSRSQLVRVKHITQDQSEALLAECNVTDATKRAQLLFIAGGRPAELHRLISDGIYFDKRAQIVKDARSFITGTPYNRLRIAHGYKDSRSNALLLLEDAQKLLSRTIASDGSAQSVKLLTRLEVLHGRVTRQGNVKLQLSAAIVA